MKSILLTLLVLLGPCGTGVHLGLQTRWVDFNNFKVINYSENVLSGIIGIILTGVPWKTTKNILWCKKTFLGRSKTKSKKKIDSDVTTSQLSTGILISVLWVHNSEE